MEDPNAMTPDRIRELCAQTEDTDLDFKEAQYDWDRDGNLELAKDIMAMANVLHAAAEPAHILVGVRQREDNTGEICGVAREQLLDDAAMHQKIERLLNATPHFTHRAVQIDAMWVGVIEVRPGGRPFFPLNDIGRNHRLRRHVASYRAGSGTTEASPTKIVEWAQVDGRIDAEAARLNLDFLRSQVEPAPRFSGHGSSSGANEINLFCTLTNVGQPTFTVAEQRATLRFTKAVRDAFESLEGAPELQRIATSDRAMRVEMGRLHFAQNDTSNVVVKIVWTEEDRHFQQRFAARSTELGGETMLPPFEIEFALTCQGPTGRTVTATHTIRWPTP
jgi:hypothetical protein